MSQLDLRSLDLLFFAGDGTMSSLIQYIGVRKIPRSARIMGTWSHVGLVVYSDVLDDPQLVPGQPYIWESTWSGGVQLRPLDDVLATYDGRIAHARLMRNPLYPSGIMYLRKRFTDLYRELNGRPFGRNPFTYIASVLPWMRRFCHRSTTDDGSALFCSELVAHVYRGLGVLPGNVRTEYVLPMDFLPGYDADRVIPPDLLAMPLMMIKGSL